VSFNALATLILVAATLPIQQTSNAQSDRGHLVTARIEDRIVKTFDFDERKLGNYEDLPMNWNKMTGPGYPWFLKPSFDDKMGRAAPPSFRLALDGGNVGANYLAKDIPVHPSSDYRITAWVRPSKLIHARATLSAYFLDHALQKIEDSERQSQVIRGAGEDEPWTPVRVDLPGGFENAAWLGLACRVEQADILHSSPDDPRPINHRDVHGIAWFDDITVLRLPKATLKLSTPGNVFLAGQPVECRARVADPDGVGLDAVLELLDADHRLLKTYPVPIVDIGSDGALITIGSLSAGRYIARLSVRIGSREVLATQQGFVQLNPDVGNRVRSRRGFGLILDLSAPIDQETSRHLLRALSPGVVKVPLWRDDTDDEAIVRGDPNLDALLHAPWALGIRFVATLEAPPASLVEQPGRPNRTLLELLAAPSDQWRPHLALMLARYGSSISAWQVGADDGETRSIHTYANPMKSSNESLLAAAIAGLRAELWPLVGSPDIVVPVPIQSQPNTASMLADILSLTVPAHISANRLSPQLTAPTHGGFARMWATIQHTGSDRYTRRSLLVELARRIVVARYCGIETVFVHQPWATATDDGGVTTVTPNEEFIVLRTLAQALAGMKPATPVWIGHGLQAWLFADETTGAGAIVTWAEAEGEASRSAVVDVGSDARRIDMWANVTDTLPTNDGRRFSVDAMPCIIAPVKPRRAKMQAGFSVDNPTFQVAVEEHERTLILAHPPAMGLRGTLRLEAPPLWRIRPKRVEIDLSGRDAEQIEISLRIPNNQAIGDYALVGRLAVEDEELGNLTLRAPLYVRSPGLDVNVMTRLAGGRLNILQRITNLTNENLNLRSYLIAPQMSFDARMVANLAAGQTAVREFQIDDARHLSGQCIRVSVRQIDGPLKNHQVIEFD